MPRRSTRARSPGIRRACPDAACGFVHWDNPLPVVAGLVEYRGQILLARNATWTEGMFALITGFLERDETPEDGIRREIKEETNLDAGAISLLGVYEFMRKNELIIAYHAVCDGDIRLSDELAEFRLVEPERVRPWRAGTEHAVASGCGGAICRSSTSNRPGYPLPADKRARGLR